MGGSFIPAWEWRRGKRLPAETQTTAQPLIGKEAAGTDYLIKGNISGDGERIYHVPGQEHYSDTKISPERGERFFCSEAEAVSAGWRKAKR